MVWGKLCLEEARHRVPCPAEDFRPNQENFHRLSRQKVALARLFTDFGYDVVLNDVDSVWLRDPTPFFSQ